MKTSFRKFLFGLIAIGIPVVLLAQSIKWYNDAAIPHKTAPVDGDILSIQQTGPNAYRWVYASDLKRYVGASNVTYISTNYAVYSTNYYYNDTYVSNFFETNLFASTVVSNYFFDFIYYTNTYQTNVTIEQYVSYNSFVSNTVISNVYNDTYTSNYFTTNVFPTTYVYTTNTIGGAFIANLNGIGTNLTVREGLSLQGDGSAPGSFDLYDAMGNYIIAGFDGTEFFGNGGGLTNLPSTSSAQVWTNDTGVAKLASSAISNASLVVIPADYGYGVNIIANPTNGNSSGGLNVSYNTQGTVVPAIGGGAAIQAIDALLDAPTSGDGMTYFGAGGVSVLGVASSNDASNTNGTVGVFGFASGRAGRLYGVVGESLPSLANSTNIGVIGNTVSSGKAGIYVGGYFETPNTIIGDGSDDPNFENSVLLLDSRDSGLSLITARTNNGTTVFKVANTGNVISSGIFYGDGSGLTNLNVQTVPNLNVTSNIYYLNAKATNVTWVGPTNTVDFSKGTVQSYVTAEPISITNVIGEMAAYQNSTILCISNSSANVITNTLTATGWKLGRFDTLVCTNAGVIQIWLQNIGGMKTVAVREYP